MGALGRSHHRFMKSRLPRKEGYLESPNVKRSFDFTKPGKIPTANNLPEDFKKKFAHKLRIRDDRIKVSGDGIFYTIQGEGPTTGMPAVFMRLQFCNLMCTWCDAFYTFNRDVEEFWKESKDLKFDQAARMLNKAWKCKTSNIQKRVVFTGGEPLLQKKQLDKLIVLLPDWNIEFETNGTQMPTESMIDLATVKTVGLEDQFLSGDYFTKPRLQFNCSPKLGHSKNVDKLRIRPEVLKKLNELNTQFKFVVMKPSDLDEIERDFVIPFGLDVNKIGIMPQGVSAQEIDMNLARVAEAAKRKGYRVFTRLHIQMFGGAKRRV